MRRCGILLHPTSLPGPHGMGDIGPMARKWLTWLESAGQRIWQMLPLTPIDGGGSPYTSPSAFARNPLLIAVDDLIEDGFLRQRDKPYLGGDPYLVDFPTVFAEKLPVLHIAADRAAAQIDLDKWAAGHPWIREWGLYRALVDENGGAWTRWPEPLRERDPDALSAARDRLSGKIARHTALQWLFAQQWARLREGATRRGIDLWGDLPIFVGGESCDTWAHRELFRLDAAGRPTVVSGVPPDAFAKKGQKWGTPLYAEPAHAAQGYRWWTDRLAALLDLVDTVRLDHFRGLAACWEVPADAPDATTGQWIPGAGAALLEAIAARFGEVPLIAEDLGIITDDVHALRDRFALPGMAILQFAFAGIDEADHPYLPHNHRQNLVVYTGTHDNDTAVGFYDAADDDTRDHVRRYLATTGVDIAWDLIRVALRSVADTAIVPMQDALSLDGSARINVPGRPDGNWGWRMGTEAMNLVLARKLSEQARLTGRAGLLPGVTPVSSPPGGTP